MFIFWNHACESGMHICCHCNKSIKVNEGRCPINTAELTPSRNYWFRANVSNLPSNCRKWLMTWTCAMGWWEVYSGAVPGRRSLQARWCAMQISMQPPSSTSYTIPSVTSSELPMCWWVHILVEAFWMERHMHILLNGVIVVHLGEMKKLRHSFTIQAGRLYSKMPEFPN